MITAASEESASRVDRHRAAIGWLAIALLAPVVAACATPISTSGYGNTAPAAASGSDPYHYRCTGACRNAG